MRNSFLVITTAMLCFSASANADRIGNGGDACENRIQSIRDDIAGWIQKGGSAPLKLPAPLTVEQYNAGMLGAIAKAKISCVDNSVFIGTVEKTCKNSLGNDGVPLIECNTKRFMNTTASDQYVLVHHEFAGVAGFEVNQDEASKYGISNQITGFLQDQVVKKLVVHPKNGYSQSGRAKVFVGPQGEELTVIPLNGNTKILLYAHNTYGIGNDKVLVYEFSGSPAEPEAVYHFPNRKDPTKIDTASAIWVINGQVQYYDLYETQPMMRGYTIKMAYSTELSAKVVAAGLISRAVEFGYPGK